MRRRCRDAVGAVAATAALGLFLAFATSAAVTAAPGRTDLRAARHRLMQIERDFQIVSERYNATRERLGGVRARIATVTLQIRRLERRVVGTQGTAVELARELYKGGTLGSLDAVLSAESITDLQRRVDYLGSSQDAQTRVFERLDADRRALGARLDELEEAQAVELASQRELGRLRSSIETKLAVQQDEVERLLARVEAAERRADRRAAAQAAAARAASKSAARDAAPAAVAPAGTNAQAAVDAALSQIGKPYQWGAAGPDAYDCSGLTMWAWAQAGVALPHNSQMQYDATARVDEDDWRLGDLLFFGSPIHHVGMYIGNGEMVAAPYTGSRVDIFSAYRSDYAGAGRPQ